MTVSTPGFLIFILITAATLVAPPPASANELPLTPETLQCRGELLEPLSFTPLAGREAVDLGWFYLDLHETVSAKDSAYIHEVAEVILPSLVAVLGPPPDEVDTLRLVIVPGGGAVSRFEPFMTMPTIRHALGVDDDRDGRIDEDPLDGFDNDGDGRVDEDLTYHRAWDSIFIHEMGHVFHNGLRLPSWAAEGYAEATQYLVAEHAAKRVQRGFQHRPNISMATDDVLNRGTSQIIGGGGQLIFRFDPSWAYRAAEVTFVLPCLAEIAAGRTDPHPLARLKNALFEEYSTKDKPSIFDAMDAAWSTPVDGLYPPSRWVRSRSLVNYWVRSRTYLHIAPGFPLTALNPSRFSLRLIQQGMYGGRVDEPPILTAFAYTDVHGNTLDVPASPYVPGLDPGAYRVDAVATTAEGQVVRAKTWILRTNSGSPIYDGGEGIALIFLDADGFPVEVQDLRVGGRIVERVPGGAIVAPHSALNPDGALTVYDGDRPLGTVTVPGQFSRVVPITVEGPRIPGAVTWSPYLARTGGLLTVTLRKDETALDPGATAIDAILCDGSSDLVRVPMEKTGVGDIWTGDLLVPDTVTNLSLRFETGARSHGRCGETEFRWSVNTGVPVSGNRPVSLASVDRVEGILILTFEEPVDPAILDLQYGPTPEGPWVPSTREPVLSPLGNHVLEWRIDPEPKSRQYIRLLADVLGTKIVLFTDVLGRTLPRRTLVPVGIHPNPSPHEVAWELEVDQPTSVLFEVFDVEGRLVHGPEKLQLLPGTREIRWKGFREGRLGAGVYFLRVTAGGSRAVAKAVLVRD